MLKKFLWNLKLILFGIIFLSLNSNIYSMDENYSLIKDQNNYIVKYYSYDTLPQPCINSNEMLLHNLDTCIVMKKQAIIPIINILRKELNADISFPNVIKLEGMSNQLIRMLAISINRINKCIDTIKSENLSESRAHILESTSTKLFNMIGDFPSEFEDLISAIIKSTIILQNNRFKEILVDQSQIAIAIKNLINKNYSESIICNVSYFVVLTLLCIGCIILTQINNNYIEGSGNKNSRIYSTFVLIFAILGAVSFGCLGSSCAYLAYNTKKEKRKLIKIMQLLENETFDIEDFTSNNSPVSTPLDTKYKSKFKNLI